jgi:hypothetical protein
MSAAVVSHIVFIQFNHPNKLYNNLRIFRAQWL